MIRLSTRVKKTICIATAALITGGILTAALVKPYRIAAADDYARMIEIRYTSDEELEDLKKVICIVYVETE